MALPYPQDIERDARLALQNLAYLTGFAVSPAAGRDVLTVGESDSTANSLPSLPLYDLSTRIERMRRYVFNQEFAEGVDKDIEAFPAVLNSLVGVDFIGDQNLHQLVNLGVDQDGREADFGTGALQQLWDHARARLNVDQGILLSFDQVATLTGKTKEAVNTAAHRGALKTWDKAKAVHPHAAIDWLMANGYVPTRDREESPDSTAGPADSSAQYVFVPVARDGTWFGPQCASGGRYTIGPKGQEVKFADFDEALEALQQMEPPRWRRPGPTAPGIVTGVRFDRMRRDQLIGG